MACDPRGFAPPRRRLARGASVRRDPPQVPHRRFRPSRSAGEPAGFGARRRPRPSLRPVRRDRIQTLRGLGPLRGLNPCRCQAARPSRIPGTRTARGWVGAGGGGGCAREASRRRPARSAAVRPWLLSPRPRSRPGPFGPPAPVVRLSVWLSRPPGQPQGRPGRASRRGAAASAGVPGVLGSRPGGAVGGAVGGHRDWRRLAAGRPRCGPAGRPRCGPARREPGWSLGPGAETVESGGGGGAVWGRGRGRPRAGSALRRRRQ